MNPPAGRKLGNTAALLQKATSQLRGEKIEKPEDELNAYISSLTQKTVKSQKAVNFEDLGDSISISSDLDIEDAPNKQQTVGSSGSKFLKKSSSFKEEDVSPAPAPVSKFLKKPQPSTTSPAPAATTPKPRYGAQSMQSVGSSGGSVHPGTSQQAGVRTSSALDKMSAITGKIQQRAAATKKKYTMESESDESFSAIKISGSADQISESQSDSFKIGKDGGKFLKKATPVSTPALVPPPSKETPLQSQSNKAKQPALSKQPLTPQKKASPFTLKSSLKYSTDVVLTSEEESLAEFVGGLPSSSGDSLDKPRVRNQYKRTSPRQSPSRTAKESKGRHVSPPNKQSGKVDKTRSPSPQSKPPVIRRTPSPSPRSPGLRRRSPSPKLMRSYSDESYAESIQDEVAENFDIGVNVIMDLDDLGPPVEDIHSLRNAPLTGSNTPSKKASKSSTKHSQSKDKDYDSPFKASKSSESSPFKSSGKVEAKSPFKASDVTDSPFKASANKERSVFQSDNRGSPFKAENKSVFKADTDYSSPFKAKNESSPFRSSSDLKASEKNQSPFFNPTPSKKPMKEKSSSPFKAPPIRTASPYSGSESKSAKRSKKSKKAQKSSNKKTNKSGGNDIFSSLGIQTVEDLLGPAQSESKASEYEEVRSLVDEVTSEVSEEIKTDKPYSNRYSRYNDSLTELATEIENTRPSAIQSYTDDFDNSISEKIGYASDRGRSSASEVRTKYSGEDTITSYTDYSDTETDTYTRSKTATDTYSYTASYTEDFSKSVVPTTTVSRSDATPRPRRGMINTDTQTDMDGLLYSWNQAGSGMAFPSVPYGLHFVDPTPIAAHVVSADALEAMTAYSPAMLALHDMLKSQYDLTREFVEMQKHLYSTSSNIQPNYHYTTLEDAKRYIKKHKKKKLSLKDALQLVDLETAQN